VELEHTLLFFHKLCQLLVCFMLHAHWFRGYYRRNYEETVAQTLATTITSQSQTPEFPLHRRCFYCITDGAPEQEFGSRLEKSTSQALRILSFILSQVFLSRLGRSRSLCHLCFSPASLCWVRHECRKKMVYSHRSSSSRVKTITLHISPYKEQRSSTYIGVNSSPIVPYYRVNPTVLLPLPILN
jgi:hypothetical protein